MTARAVEQSLFPEHRPDRPTGPLVGSVQTGTNADLIATIAPLYLEGRTVMDVTYGRGGWWKRYRPPDLVAHDLAVDGVDFRALPELDRSVDVVCFDPPYVLSGGVSSANLGDDFQDRYGIGPRALGRNTVGATTSLEGLILDGLTECVRVARELVLVKCMEYSQGSHVPPSRSFHDIPNLVTTRAIELGAAKHDQIVHHTGSGPGGHNIFTPKRARRHHSYLIVFEVSA